MLLSSALPTITPVMLVPYLGKLGSNRYIARTSFGRTGCRSLGLLLAIQPDDPVGLLLGQALEIATAKVLKHFARDIVTDNLFDCRASLTGFVLEIIQVGGPVGFSDQAGKNRGLILLSVCVVCHKWVTHCSYIMQENVKQSTVYFEIMYPPGK